MNKTKRQVFSVVWISLKGWHAAQTNSIFDCVVELAIALVLCPGCTQIGRFRIQALAEYRLPPSVIRMARSAMIGEMLHASPNVLRRRRDGIAKSAIGRWHGHFACRCAANSSIADGVASALKPRRTRISPYPTTATARANRISKPLSRVSRLPILSNSAGLSFIAPSDSGASL